jgi:cell division control protein 45
VSDDDEADTASGNKRKRRSTPEFSDNERDSDPDEGTPSKKRRSNSSSPIPSSPGARPGRRGLLILSQQNKSTESEAQSSSLPGPSSTLNQPSAKVLRRQLLLLRRKHDKVLQAYYSLGTSYSEPISSLMWSLASDLGRENNDLLWLAIVGVSSLELSGRTSSGIGLSPLSTSGGSSGWNNERGAQIKSILRDEVRRLNPIDLKDIAREGAGEGGIIQTHAKNPEDMSIRLSPEPRFLLVRHWSLYDSMLHSLFLSAKLHMWNENGKKRLRMLLAKMGISLSQCKQNYTHMDMELKRGLREKLLKYAPVYGLEGLVPPESRHNTKEGWGFVRCWGWKACLSALDVGTILGAILEVGDLDPKVHEAEHARITAHVSYSGTNTPRNPEKLVVPGAAQSALKHIDEAREDAIISRFFAAYDALGDISKLTKHIPTAQHLHRAILRTGTSLIEKKQIKRLKPFHIVVVKEGPDVKLFTHPGALIKLALWIAEAITEMEGMKGKRGGELVMAGLDEERGVYVVVGLGGGSAVAAHREREARKSERRKEREKRKEERKAEKARRKELRRERLEALGESDVEDDETESESEDESDSEDEAEGQAERGKGLNRFGNAFQEVIEETGARVKVDSFEHCVVEVRKEDLQSFFESLCMKAVVG